MLSKRILITLYLCLVVSASIAAGQDPPPVAKRPGTATKTVELPSLREVTEANRFSSTEWLFSIGLPKSITGYAAIAPKDTPANLAGDVYQWRLREGDVVMTCVNYLDPSFSLATEKAYADFFKGVTEGTLTRLHATFTSGTPVPLNGMKGYRYRFQMPNGAAGIGRVYYKDKRSWSMIAIASKDLGGAELMLTMALDSFSPVDKTKVDEDIRKSVEASTPAALPQEPIAKKEKTDAKDENLKGKVKTVTEESEDLSGTSSVQGKHLSSIDDYDDNGNWIKKVLYESNTKPFEIIVYGYIDGARVCHSKFIRHESDPPPAISGGQATPARVRDKRYTFKFEYEYGDGKLVGEKIFSNDGAIWTHTVYKYTGNQLEEVVYDEKGKVNQKYLYKLDTKGEAIEQTDVDAVRVMNGDRKYAIKYESFDAHGNWTKKTTSKLVNDDGKEIYKPWYVSYRTISYY